MHFTVRTLLLTIVLSALLQGALAQKQPRLFTGIAVCPTLTRSSEVGTLNKFSFNGELRVHYKFSEWLAIESGLGILNHGYRREIEFIDTVNGESWKEIFPLQLNYFTIPLRLRVYANGFTFSPGIVNQVLANVNPSYMDRLANQHAIAWQIQAGYMQELYSGAYIGLEFFHTQPFSPLLNGHRFQNTGICISAIFPIHGPGGYLD